ncbi:probable DNA replication complex GINS protein PSF2 [Chelonus insularis]|uniref:probable DNA replication complex GINS protein PSF2 n=1 Tax=Chelonus insularis TaxID=460826 RepID=UPI00158BCD3C|nr:probable DNA replication complex GINS protein PSF2 [Chelonus insularis]
MDSNEIEFLGEAQQVKIVPNFNFGQIHLISGSVGPFRAGMPVIVPIWLAINLKQQQKCRIVCPNWMETENLQVLKENEKLSKAFTVMPSNHYMDEAHILLSTADEDLHNVDNIRTTVKDIWDLRMSKLRTFIDELFKNQSGVYAMLNHLTAMEIASIKPLLPYAMDQQFRLNTSEYYTRASPA